MQWLITGGQNGQIIIWYTATDGLKMGKIWEEGFDLGEQLWDLDWHNNLLVAAAGKGSVKVWDMVTGEVVANYGGHQGAVCAADWSPDGRFWSR